MVRKLAPWKTTPESPEVMVEMEICPYCRASSLTTEGTRAAAEASKVHHWFDFEKWKAEPGKASDNQGKNA